MTRKKAIEAAMGEDQAMNHTELRAALAEDERIQKRPVLTSCAFHCDFSKDARTRWPERTRQLREALAEIDLLKGAMAADEERLRTHGMRVGIWFGCDTAEHMADEIEALKAENARLSLTTGVPGDQLAAGLLERIMAEIERLKAAGKVLAESLRTNWGGEISRKEDEACKVFEEEN